MSRKLVAIPPSELEKQSDHTDEIVEPVINKVVVSGYSYSSFRTSSWIDPPQPKYDEIVDKTDFRPDSEEIRALKVSSDMPGSQPKYDYQDGKVPEDDPVTDVILALRSGKLDKADVQKLAAVVNENAKAEAKDSAEKSKLDAEANALKNRQKALDSALGVNLPENE